MKRKNLVFALLLAVAGIQTAWAQKVVFHFTDKHVVEYSTVGLDSIVFVESTFADGHEYVDLGLPSGTMWATCNVGANSPEEFGTFFAWGETSPKQDYSWRRYQHCNRDMEQLTKYCIHSDYGTVDNKRELDPEDDAATVNWGESWQMPSRNQIKELIAHTTAVWTTVHDVEGMLLTSKHNDNSIFLPAGGVYEEVPHSGIGAVGSYWSRSLDGDYSFYACMLNINIVNDPNGMIGQEPYERSWGFNVRPVLAMEEVHEYVDLGLPSGTLWAKTNVGAFAPEDYGDYFAWGETYPKSDYDWYNYAFGTERDLTKYNNSDGLTELLPEDDAATANWGNDWQMPSELQCMELMDENYVEKVLTTQNDVPGWLITSKHNGASIFLPAAGLQVESDRGSIEVGNDGFYWSRSLDGSDSRNMWLSHSIMANDQRRFGLSVRPVRVQETQYEWLVTGIQVSPKVLNLHLKETAMLTATVVPAYAKNQEVTWESSDESIATVNSIGIVTAKSFGECYIMCRATDGSNVFGLCTVKVKDYDYVDLGLPSGTLWATVNVGADSPEANGKFFAWGETTNNVVYTWDSYKWHIEGESGGLGLSKYTFADGKTEASWYNSDGDFIGDNIKELLPEDDAATANWGDGWQMPTPAQFEELFDSRYTTRTWTTKNGVKGYEIRRNGNSIFLPAAGYRDWTEHDGEGTYGHYWSRSLDTLVSYRASHLFFHSSMVDTNQGDNRFDGYNVRAVRKQ
jgi:hypothetical protein